jgi:ubiquinone/menaquinone biosynthesis C-methylase UbiE
MPSKNPTYGTSLHYSGEAGIKYLEWQDALGVVSGKINSRKFKEVDFHEKTVLDFGAGTGNLLENLPASKKIAVEINAAAHPSIVKKGIEAFDKIEDIQASSIDIAISHHSLEHVPYPIMALKEIARVLKPDGCLHLWVPIDDWRMQRLYNSNDINHHLNTWTPQLLGNTLKEAGFETKSMKIKIVTHAWFPGYQYLFKAPGFDLACRIWSILKRRRQIYVITQVVNQSE